MKLRRSRILLLVFALAAVFFMLFFAVGIIGADSWRNFDLQRITGCDRSSVLYDDEGNEIVRLHGAEDRTWVSSDMLPKHLLHAFISAEDARFYEHEGVDIIRIAGAIIADIKAGGYVQGASTISQQLIKLSHLSSEKTISRKAEEAVLAYQMERRCTKQDILEMYLNYVYFGGGYYGVEAAAMGYFGVHAAELSLSQSAMLAGILKSPGSYAPHLDYEASISRRNTVLSLMNRYGYISEDEMIQASAERPKIQHGQIEEYSGYYTDAVIRSAAEVLEITVDELLRGGYHVYSGLNTELQLYCEEIFADDSLFPTQEAEGALIIQNPHTGLIVSMIGGREHTGSMGFNRAIDIRRQPGSVIKPIISYAPAFEYLGYTAADMILDEETAFAEYTPSNFGSKYYGWVTMREAVSKSLNVPAVKVLSEVGVNRAKGFASACGIEFDSKDNSLALALGGFTYGVSPLHIAGAYSCFAAGGEYNTPSVIRYITDSEGEILYEYNPEHKRVLSEENAYILTSMLKSVVSEGTGHRLNTLSIPIAGKTGTVGTATGNRDAWMASYTPEYTAVVWMGYDNDNLGTLPAQATGGTYPAMILYKLYSYLYPEGYGEDFNKPEGVSEYSLDAYSLKVLHKVALANVYTPEDSRITELFTLDTAPGTTTSYWAIPATAQNFTLAEYGGNIRISFDCPDDFGVYSLHRKDDRGKERTLKTWNGTEGHIEFTDSSVTVGKTYSYYVSVHHESMTIGEKKVYGLPTQEFSILAENKVIIINLVE
ncbi:MAG: PBP1A family penicillin-binding protein [Clostridia bacterium]|nr:PBP1A family penicillin-binding protein [Clostridia bacterium]